jgi:hypothetical protein
MLKIFFNGVRFRTQISLSSQAFVSKFSLGLAATQASHAENIKGADGRFWPQHSR